MACTSGRFLEMRISANEIGNALLADDVARLSAQLGCDVDLLRNGDLLGIVISAFQTPAGLYNKPETDVLMQTTTQYPVSAMDMFWVDEDLTLANGSLPIGGESIEVHFDRRWRRYSWHRNVPWQPGRDDLVGHFEFALARLQRPE
jgi:hypothetical protein